MGVGEYTTSLHHLLFLSIQVHRSRSAAEEERHLAKLLCGWAKGEMIQVNRSNKYKTSINIMSFFSSVPYVFCGGESNGGGARSL